VDALRTQTLQPGTWEFLLIDNASDPRLDSTVDLSWHQAARHVREEKLGLSAARLRGIQEAQGDLLVFVDDDNVLDPDFLEQALKIANEWPRLGSWSGDVRPEFEVSPPEWTKRYWGSLALRSLEYDAWSNQPHLPDTMPCGAGLCVRKSVGEHYVMLHSNGRRGVVLDRIGNSLMSAGDNDLAACACDVGLGVGVFAALKLTHLIPAERLEENYLLQLVENIAFSGVIFRSFREPSSVPRESLSTTLANIARQLRMSSRDRNFFRANNRGERRAAQYLAAHVQSTNGHRSEQPAPISGSSK
jgi:hypothetical protein